MVEISIYRTLSLLERTHSTGEASAAGAIQSPDYWRERLVCECAWHGFGVVRLLSESVRRCRPFLALVRFSRVARHEADNDHLHEDDGADDTRVQWVVVEGDMARWSMRGG